MSFFEVDSKGLAKIAGRRGKGFVLLEIVQNCLDTKATEIHVEFRPIAGRPAATLIVSDDHPDGFKDLSHAWTLFAESEKKGDPEKRGRFNLGEKLVLSLCEDAEIVTTTGGVRFDKEGRHTFRKKTDCGSVFSATIRMTRDEYAEACKAVKTVIVPEGKRVFFNGETLKLRVCIGSESVVLPTEIADEEGYLRRTTRRTVIRMYEPLSGEPGTLYELGIPVVETGDKFHYDIQQKVPLTMERDGVPRAYLRAVRAATLNTLAREIKSVEDASAPWVRDAMSHESIQSRPVQKIMDARFGAARVVFDPSDPEANNIAMSQGMKVIHGASLTAEEWVNVRKYEAALPAGQVTPSPKPFSPDGKPLVFVDPGRYTQDQIDRTAMARRVGAVLLGFNPVVQLTDTKPWKFAATYNRVESLLILNWAKIWAYRSEAMISLLIHEYAHHYESNHLAEGFHDACCKLGAKLAVLAADDRSLVRL